MANVLVVDDASISRRNLKSIFTMAGHAVVAEASNGLQAFIEYEKHAPDLVTMDITMPVMDGIHSIKKILGSYPDARIIVVSALDQRPMIFDAIQSGAKHYIIKPFAYDKVIEVVNQVLYEKPAARNPAAYTSNSIPADIEGSSGCAEITETTKSISSSKASTSTLEEISRPFFIESRNGIYVVNIFQNLDMNSLAGLNLGVKRISTTTPLKVLFNFNTISNMSNELLTKVIQIIENVRLIGGTAFIASQNKDFILTLLNRNIDIYIYHYTGSLDVSRMTL